MTLLRQLFRLIDARLGEYAGLLIAIAAVAILSTFAPLGLGLTTDALVRHDVTRALLIACAVLAAGVVGAIVNAYERAMATRFLADMATRLRRKLHEHLTLVPLSEHARLTTGQILNACDGDVDLIVGNLTGLLPVASSLISLLAIIALFPVANWRMGLVGLFVVPAWIGTTILNKRRITAARESIQSTRDELTGFISETLSESGVAYGKLYAAHEADSSTLRRLSSTAGGARRHLTAMLQSFYVSQELLVAAGPVAAMIVGIVLYAHGLCTIGALVASVGLVVRVYGPASYLAVGTMNLRSAEQAVGRITKLLQVERETGTESLDGRRSDPSPTIIFDRVCVRFGERDALSQLSLHVESGARVAIVGPNGSGKSTALNALVRFAPLRAGAIWFGGQNVADLRCDELRAAIGFLPQDPLFRSGTVRENLGRGASDADLNRACRLALADDLVASLRDGYETVVDPGGRNFSRGERQRLAIARLIVLDPAVLVMDEALNAVGETVERAIMRNLLDRFLDRTFLVVTHRPELYDGFRIVSLDLARDRVSVAG